MNFIQDCKHCERIQCDGREENGEIFQWNETEQKYENWNRKSIKHLWQFPIHKGTQMGNRSVHLDLLYILSNFKAHVDLLMQIKRSQAPVQHYAASY